MKLALLYTTWTGDDMEMLKKSIKNNSVFADGVIVCCQEKSNIGNNGNTFIYQDCFFNKKQICLLDFLPNLDLNPKENERIKHNQMIQAAKREGYTHFILCAGDHFYEHDQVQFARQWHLDNPEIEVSLTRMITYYKNENWCLYPLESYCMPFIHKINQDTEISKTAKYPVIVDPSVKINASKFHVFNENEVILHHYSMIRKDIVKKFRNAASSYRWTEKQVNTFISEYENAKIGDKISYFNGLELVEKDEIIKLLSFH